MYNDKMDDFRWVYYWEFPTHLRAIECFRDLWHNIAGEKKLSDHFFSTSTLPRFLGSQFPEWLRNDTIVLYTGLLRVNHMENIVKVQVQVQEWPSRRISHDVVVAISIIRLFLMLILKVENDDISYCARRTLLQMPASEFSVSVSSVKSFILEGKDVSKGKGISCTLYARGYPYRVTCQSIVVIFSSI